MSNEKEPIAGVEPQSDSQPDSQSDSQPDQAFEQQQDSQAQANQENGQSGQAKIVQATKIVNKYSGLGAGAGIVPLPVLDLMAISSVNVMMIKELYDLYGISFNQKRARTVINLLLASLSPKLLAGVTAASFTKFIPVLGSALGSLSMPLLSSASTYVTGNLMISHLEAGGALEDFNVQKHKGTFSQAIEAAINKGKHVAESVKQTVKTTQQGT